MPRNINKAAAPFMNLPKRRLRIPDAGAILYFQEKDYETGEMREVVFRVEGEYINEFVLEIYSRQQDEACLKRFPGLLESQTEED